MLKDYLDSLEDQFESQAGFGSDWLQSFKLKSFNTFREIGFPISRKGNEKWKYTSVSPIVNNVFQVSQPKSVDIDLIKQVAPWSKDWYNIVFIDGYIDHDISNLPNSGISIDSLNSAQDRIGQLTDVSDDGFAALNSAFLSV